MVLKLLLEVLGELLKSNICVKITMYSAKESASFINKEGTLEEKVSNRSWPQLNKWFIVSWKLCLNLCSLKWLRPSLSLLISLIPSGLNMKKRIWGSS